MPLYGGVPTPAASAAANGGSTDQLQAYQDQFAAGGGSVGGGTSTGQYQLPSATNPLVYMGMSSNGDDSQGEGKGAQQSTQTLASALTYFQGFGGAEQQAMANKFYRAGIIDNPDDLAATYQQWQNAVNYASDAYTYGGKQLTPWDVIQQQIGAAKAGIKKGLNHGPANTTSTVTQVLTNGDANTMIKAMYQNELGRDPTAGELSRYRSMLINKSKDSPSVTQTHNTYNSRGQQTDSSQTQSGGFDQNQANDLLQQSVQADPEYGAYQAATTYMGAIEQAMSGSPNLGGSADTTNG